jgi:hypothetical protein
LQQGLGDVQVHDGLLIIVLSVNSFRFDYVVAARTGGIRHYAIQSSERPVPSQILQTGRFFADPHENKV